MFIILEGTDASGKSTLADAVRTAMKLRQPSTSLMEIHNGKPRDLMRESVLQDYVFDIENNHYPYFSILADRWHWGEVTYAAVKRPETNIDGYGLLRQAGWRWVELFLASRGGATFWVNQPLEVVKARMAIRGDDYITADELERIYDLYHVAARNVITLADTLHPEAYSLDAIPELANYVVSRALFEEKQVEFLRVYPEYIGVANPKAVFVTADIDSTRGTALPLVPTDGSPGELFFETLEEEAWRRIGVINLNDDTVAYLPELLKKLGSPKLIAMGTDVANSLLSVFHPSQVTHMKVTPRDVLTLPLVRWCKYRQELDLLINEPDYQGDESWQM